MQSQSSVEITEFQPTDDSARKDSAPTEVGDGDEQQARVAPTLFADERGNLKYVALAVKAPCCMLCSTLAVCLLMTIGFVAVASQGSAIITTPKEYDPFEEKSIKFVSMTSARAFVNSARDSASTGVQPTLSEMGDIT